MRASMRVRQGGRESAVQRWRARRARAQGRRARAFVDSHSSSKAGAALAPAAADAGRRRLTEAVELLEASAGGDCSEEIAAAIMVDDA